MYALQQPTGQLVHACRVSLPPRQRCLTLPSCRARPALSQARAVRCWSSKNGVHEEPEQIMIPILNIPIPTKLYFAAEIAVLLAQLMLVDAAYSGDWSRIGVITTDTELVLQKVVIFIVVAHSIVALLTAKAAQARGINPGTAAFKGLLFGSMALYEVMQQEEKEVV